MESFVQARDSFAILFVLLAIDWFECALKYSLSHFLTYIIVSQFILLPNSIYIDAEGTFQIWNGPVIALKNVAYVVPTTVTIKPSSSK